MHISLEEGYKDCEDNFKDFLGCSVRTAAVWGYADNIIAERVSRGFCIAMHIIFIFSLIASPSHFSFLSDNLLQSCSKFDC